jgi:hypothetical protein
MKQLSKKPTPFVVCSQQLQSADMPELGDISPAASLTHTKLVCSLWATLNLPAIHPWVSSVAAA